MNDLTVHLSGQGDSSAKPIEEGKGENPIGVATKEKFQTLASSFSEMESLDLDKHQITESLIPSSEDPTTSTLMSIDCNTIALFPKDDVDLEKLNGGALSHNGDLSQELITHSVNMVSSEEHVAAHLIETPVQDSENIEEDDLFGEEATEDKLKNTDAKKENAKVEEDHINKQEEKSLAKLASGIKVLSSGEGLIAESISATIYAANLALLRDAKIACLNEPAFKQIVGDEVHQFEPEIKEHGYLETQHVNDIVDKIWLKTNAAKLLIDLRTQQPVDEKTLEDLKEKSKEALLKEFQSRGWLAPTPEKSEEKTQEAPQPSLKQAQLKQAVSQNEDMGFVAVKGAPNEKVTDHSLLLKDILAMASLTKFYAEEREKKEEAQALEKHEWIILKEIKSTELKRDITKQGNLKFDLALLENHKRAVHIHVAAAA